MIPTSPSLTVADEIRRAAKTWREYAGQDALAGKTVTSVWNQLAFRWRKDDGNETTATWWAANDTNPSPGDLTLDANVRIRFEIEETATGTDGATLTAQLQYSLNSTTSYNNVTGASSVVRSSAGGGTDGEPTTNLVDTSARAFQAGEYDEVDGVTAALSGLSNESTNVEYCVQIRSADVTGGDVIRLRVINSATPLDTYTQTPAYEIPLSDPGGSFPLTDTFTDTDGTLIQNHLPDSSSSSDSIWHPLGFPPAGGSSSQNAEVRSNRAQSAGSTAASRAYRNTAVPASAEYDVECDAALGSTVYLIGRMTSAGTTAASVDRYQCGFRADGSVVAMPLQKSVSGTITTLDSVDPGLGTATAALKLELRDAAKKAYIDSTEYLTSADNAITQVGRAGLGLPGNSTNTRYIDNFSATDAAVVEPEYPNWRRTAHVPGQRFMTPGTLFGRSW